MSQGLCDGLREYQGQSCDRRGRTLRYREGGSFLQGFALGLVVRHTISHVAASRRCNDDTLTAPLRKRFTDHGRSATIEVELVARGAGSYFSYPYSR
jgi:hypothetical protein